MALFCYPRPVLLICSAVYSVENVLQYYIGLPSKNKTCNFQACHFQRSGTEWLNGIYNWQPLHYACTKVWSGHRTQRSRSRDDQATFQVGAKTHRSWWWAGTHRTSSKETVQSMERVVATHTVTKRMTTSLLSSLQDTPTLQPEAAATVEVRCRTSVREKKRDRACIS